MDGRIDELKQDIGRRIRSVMPQIPEAEFNQLIQQMAELQYKYEVRERYGLLPDSSAD